MGSKVSPHFNMPKGLHLSENVGTGRNGDQTQSHFHTSSFICIDGLVIIVSNYNPLNPSLSHPSHLTRVHAHFLDTHVAPSLQVHPDPEVTICRSMMEICNTTSLAGPIGDAKHSICVRWSQVRKREVVMVGGDKAPMHSTKPGLPNSWPLVLIQSHRMRPFPRKRR